jgi:putative peptide zinc metalloprotease protein
MVLGLVVLSAAFHECGHATACRYGGAKPGVLGAGIYLVWPAFYSDVTDAYRLDKIGRLRTDLGGIYFNMIFSLLTAGAYFLTGFEPLLAVIVLQHLEMLHQLLPFLRLDGYYVIADLTGVPDMFARIKPILRSVVPGREPDESVTALKPWVRVVVTAWVLMVIPILLYVFSVMAMSAPRIFATAWDSFFIHYDKVSSALSEGKALASVAGVVQMVFLVLPAGGMTMTFGRVGKRLGTAVWNRTEGEPALRASYASVALVTVGFVAFLWWPNGDYKPIQPGERGTIQGGLAQVADISTGRPSLTPKREQELGGAPTERSKRDGDQPRESDETPATETTTTTTPTDTTSTTTTPTTTEPSATTPTTTTSTQTTSTETTSTTTTPTTTTTTTTTP